MSISITEIRKNNLKKIIETYPSQQAFAEKIERSTAQVSAWLGGWKNIGEKLARNIENKLGLDIYSLDKEAGATKEQESEVEIFYIPEYSLQLSAGTGCDFLDEHIIKRYPVDKELLLKFGWKAEKLIIVSVLGESMAPEIQDGAKVVINTADKELKDGKVFAFCKNNETFIKRAFRKSGTNDFDLSSDNPRYGKVPLCEYDNIMTLGRAVYILGKEI